MSLEAIYQAIANAHPLLLVDLQTGKIIHASPLAEQTFGYIPHGMNGVIAEELMPEGLRARHVAHRAEYARLPTIKRMGDRLGPLKALKKDGTEFDVEITLSPVRLMLDPPIDCAVLLVLDRSNHL